MREISYSEALREAIREEMLKDENVIMIGEEIGLGICRSIWSIKRTL